MNLSELAVGYRFAPMSLTLDEDQVARYLAAVDDSSGPQAEEERQQVPPLAVIAAGLSRLIDELGLAAGTVHAGQEVEFIRPVWSGELVHAESWLIGNSVRRESRFSTIQTEFRGEAGDPVAMARSTVVVPA